MNGPQPHFEPAFVAAQRQKLIASRAALSSAMNLTTRETELVDAARDDASEMEDRAQDLSIVENDGLVRESLAERRLSVERALERIDEGTYGFSEVSGQPIPLGRLEAYPEATRTETEEARHARCRTIPASSTGAPESG